MRLRRSELAVPASNARMVEKSAQSDADLVFLDLEDATAPEMKEGARQRAVDALNGLDWGNKVRCVRVNDHTTRWATDDVISVVEGAGENLDLLILPKVKQPRDVCSSRPCSMASSRSLVSSARLASKSSSKRRRGWPTSRRLLPRHRDSRR